MNKIRNIFKNNKKHLFLALLFVLGSLYFVFKNGNSNNEAYVVGKTDVAQSILLSGQVMTSDRADLGFAASGRVARIYVKNNQKVYTGQTLAQLEINDLVADLKIKQANSRVSGVDLDSAKEQLESVTTQENTKVESAHRKLLSEGLVLVPNSDNYSISAPSITGVYDSSREGTYKVIIDKKNITSSDIMLKTFDLEKTNLIINENGSTPLGTKGLYISFEDDQEAYLDTIWYLSIPNKSSSEYLSNLSSYNEAKKNRDLNIQSAESKYEKFLAEEDGGDTVAQAEIQKVNAEIRKNTIYAPFSGQVTNIEKEVGENASNGERVISILGEKSLEIVLQVSELDVTRLIPGAEIKISLDAISEEEFVGTLKTINARETQVDGVPVYEAFVDLKADLRIRTGMSANGKIIISEKKDVIAIPTYFITKKDGKNTVSVLDANDNTLEKEVTLGITGTDSMVEVTGGLDIGERIVSVNKK